MEKKLAESKSIVLMLVLCLAAMILGFTNSVNATLIDNGDGTVTDDLGIMWLQESFDEPMTWSAAMAWAEDLVFAGYDDWRLPSAIHFTNGLPDTSYNSINNEWGHLYGVEWNDPAHPSDILPMTRYQCLWYWTSTEYDATQAYAFFVSYDGLWLNQEFAKEETKCVTAVRAAPSGPLVCDINGDGVVDIFDVVILAKAFGSYPGHPKWNPDADLNSDDAVDIFDCVIIAKNYGATA